MVMIVFFMFNVNGFVLHCILFMWGVPQRLTPGALSVGRSDVDGVVGRDRQVAAEGVEGLHSPLLPAVVDLQHLQGTRHNSATIAYIVF